MAGSYSVVTPRTVGAAALLQNLFTIQNAQSSGLVVVVRLIDFTCDATAALTAVSPAVRLSRPTALPTGGADLAPVARGDTRFSLPAAIVCRAATASDGGAATAITATAGPSFRTRQAPRLHTLVGLVSVPPIVLWQTNPMYDPLALRPGEAVLVQVVAAVASSNPATNHWSVNCDFDLEDA
jgi:hypothetical protein